MDLSPWNQEERGALALVNGIVYVPYSGYVGDCGPYHGWVVGVHIDDPSIVMAWATAAEGGGIWGHGGVASDGTNMFVVTGNTFTNPGDPWSGGEAIVRLQAGPVFSTIFGRLPIGSRLITAIPILVVAAPPSSMCPARPLHSWFSPWVKIAMPIC